MNEKLGFYVCDGQTFTSKIQACLYAHKHQKPLEWNFNKELFSKINWQHEPEQSLDTLYDIRAREIREKYDYVILSYSAGADSNNILESFLRQHLFIDEILVNHSTKYDTLTVTDPAVTSSWNAGAEYQLQTIPRIKYLQNVSPNTKITVCDMSEGMFDMLESVGDESWTLTSNEKLNLGGALRYNYIYFKDVRNRFDKSKKIAIMTGVDKPRTFIDKDNMFYLFFNDRAANIVNAQTHFNEYTNTTVENFYWSPDAADILVKQAHVVKRWLERNMNYKNLWTLHDREQYGKNFRLYHERLLRTIIYSTWDNQWYQADKSISEWYNEFDAWFYTKHTDTNVFQIWKSGLDYVTDNTGDFTQYQDGKATGLKSFYQIYKIGKLNVNE